MRFAKTIPIVAFVYNLFFCLVLGSVAFGATESAAVATLVGASPMVYAFWPTTKPLEAGLYEQAIVKIFLKDLQRNLFPQNIFYKKSKLDAGGRIQGDQCIIPISGILPEVFKNPQNFPLPLGNRKDFKKIYDVDLFATTPIHMPDVDLETLSYDKRMDILQDHVDTLNTQMANEAAYGFAPTLASRIVRTTGGNTGTLAAGAAGTRKALLYANFLDAFTILREDDLPTDELYMMYPARMGKEIRSILEFKDFDKTGVVGAVATGTIGKIQGSDTFERSSSVLYDNQGTPVKKPVGSLADDDDNQSIIIWHPSMVRRAEGNIKNYARIGDPAYLGDVVNASVRFGTTISRLDEKGVVAIVQAA